MALISFKKLFPLLAFIFAFNFSHASGGEGEFKAGEMIMHHISDAHEIHFFGHVAIPLPVIIVDGGVKVFMSGSFYHNPKTTFDPKSHSEVEYYEHEGYVLYHEKIYKLSGEELKLDAEGHPMNAASVVDLSITKSVLGLFIVMFIVIFIFKSIAKKYSQNEGKAPNGLQNALEPFILFIRDEVAKPSIGHHYERFMPFLLTIFFFIWTSNILGLIPFLGGFNIMGTLSVTMVFALGVFVVTSINGNSHYWGHLLNPPGVPGFVKIILVPIEIAGIFIKPIVLMIRLTANITAGHIIILAFVSLIFIFGQSSAATGYGVGVGATAFMVFMNVLELLVAFLQAYVFTLLAAIYFGSAVEEAHH
ncbi:MAG: F0F1 ATP synthase subunit A [Flavobacteriales bacterium]|nr:F0F1 ATP synthase subunit A [Flavobacteriales bacterium]